MNSGLKMQYDVASSFPGVLQVVPWTEISSETIFICWDKQKSNFFLIISKKVLYNLLFIENTHFKRPMLFINLLKQTIQQIF